MGPWTCPSCHRQFGRRNQSHECAPAITLDEYFSTGPARGRPIVNLRGADDVDDQIRDWLTESYLESPL